jgi:hypothetical protein
MRSYITYGHYSRMQRIELRQTRPSQSLGRSGLPESF